MVLSQQHSEEIFWLKRRLQFLFEIDQLQRRGATTDDIMAVVDEFRKVEKTSDLVQRLRDIYGDQVH